MNKERFETIIKIIERAESMGIAYAERITHIMDMENADKQFDLRLDLMLEADDLDFVHDFLGIYGHMDRSTGKCVDFFVPRFAGCYHPLVEA